jgi:hypothetical protein
MSTNHVDSPLRTLTSICVFCGANSGHNTIYQEAAVAMGRALAAHGLRLVYGGGSVGLMGVLARTVEASGSPVVSVIPKSLITRELSGDLIGEAVIVDTMHERKAIMAQRSDAFVVMPGGFGTLDELFEMITWGQLGIQAKPLGILNINGYFTPLIQMIDRAVTEGFIRPEHRQLFVQSTNPEDLLTQLATQDLPDGLVKWMDVEEI